MNYLITGSSGYIGSRLLKRVYTGTELSEIAICDLRLGIDILNIPVHRGVDFVYHLAAQAGVASSQFDPINDARQNILGTIKAIQIANVSNARLIFPTSGAAVEPESPYGLSKKTAERYVKMLCEDYVILRLSSVYGDKPRGVVDTFIREDKCVIYGDGSAERDFVHVDDIVELFIQAKDFPTGSYECGSGKGTNIKTLAQATGRKIEYQDAKKGEKKSVVLENTTPSWEPKIDVLDYIREKCGT